MRREVDLTVDVEAAKGGDTIAFERIVRTHADAVYGHALRFFGEHQAAEDAAQEVFLKVYKSLSAFDGRSSFSTWLYAVTRNVCLDLFRRGKRRPLPIDPLATPDPSAPDFADGVTRMRAVEVAMASLAPEDREALGAVTLFGLSYAEAAGVLSVPAGTVKSRVFRARRTLLHMLADDDVKGGVA